MPKTSNSVVLTVFLTGIICMGTGYIGFRVPSVIVDQANVPPNRILKFLPKTICNVYDTSAATQDRHECVLAKWRPPFYVCIHPVKEDIHVSNSIKQYGFWEKHILEIFQNLLKLDPEYGVIDIGANIGEYALLGAIMGRGVVAVEARLLHVEMIHHALHRNNLHNRKNFMLLHNAISDNHNMLQLTLADKVNQGHMQVIEGGKERANISKTEVSEVPAVYLDDLTEVINFRKAVMKIDIEGSELKATAHCEKLLNYIFIPYIILEWHYLINMPLEQQFVLDILTRNGYSQITLEKGQLPLGTNQSWPTYIIWKHKNASST